MKSIRQVECFLYRHKNCVGRDISLFWQRGRQTLIWLVGQVKPIKPCSVPGISLLIQPCYFNERYNLEIMGVEWPSSGRIVLERITSSSTELVYEQLEPILRKSSVILDFQNMQTWVIDKPSRGTAPSLLMLVKHRSTNLLCSCGDGIAEVPRLSTL